MRKTFFKKIAVGVMALSLLGAFAPVTTPEVVVADEVDLDNPDYNAYIGLQTPNWSFRDAWNNPSTGIDGSEGLDYSKMHQSVDGDWKDLPGDITDAHIDGNGTYTVKAENLQFADDEFASQEKMNLIFFSTDIPKSDAITISDVILKIDGSEVTHNGTINDEEEDYIQYQIQSLWSEDPAIVDIGYYPVPFSSVEITFTVSGFNKDSEQAVEETEPATEETVEASNSNTDDKKADTKKDTKSDESSSTGLVVAGVVVAIIAVVALVFVALKKKK